MKTQLPQELLPGIARDLGAEPQGGRPIRTGFLNWAVRQVEEWEQLARETPDRQRRFEYQNRMAGLVAAASAYGDWLWKTARL